MNPIIPKTNANPGAGAPSSLYLGELASNRSTGKLYLGCDAGIVEVGGAGGTSGSTVTQFTGNGTSVAFSPIGGYSDTAVGSYLVSVGGIDQRPTTDWTISSTNSGTITFASAPPAGASIVVRAFTGSSGGGGSGDATSLQGRALASTAPTDGQAIVWDDAAQTWKPGTVSGGGSSGTITFNTAGVHYFSVPSGARWARLQASAGTGGNGDAGADGTDGSPAYQDGQGIWRVGADGTNGADGVTAGEQGKSVKVAGSTVATGGAGGLGYGGGGGGGGARWDCLTESGNPVTAANNGLAGNGPSPGLGGDENGTSGANGGDGLGAAGGLGGDGGYGAAHSGGNGGAGDSATGSGGGGGAGGFGPNFGESTTSGLGGKGGKGGSGAGKAGQSVDLPYNLTTYAGATLLVEITDGNGNASITFTW